MKILLSSHSEFESADKVLKRDFVGFDNVVTIHDASVSKAPIGHNITDEDIDKLKYPRASDKQFEKLSVLRNVQATQLWYNSLYKALWYYRNINNKEDYYWLIEDDVYNPNWKKFFEAFKNSSADLIAGDIKIDKPDSKHKIFRLFDFDKMPKEYKKKGWAFGIAQRYSNRLLKEIDELLSKGYHTHYEQLAISVVINNDMKFEDINKVHQEKYGFPAWKGNTISTKRNRFQAVALAQSWKGIQHPIK
jgi:hypothetical protein